MYKCEFNAEQNDGLQLGLIISWVTGEHKLDNYYDPGRKHPPKRQASDRFFCSFMDGKYIEEQPQSCAPLTGASQV